MQSDIKCALRIEIKRANRTDNNNPLTLINKSSNVSVAINPKDWRITKKDKFGDITYTSYKNMHNCKSIKEICNELMLDNILLLGIIKLGSKYAVFPVSDLLDSMIDNEVIGVVQYSCKPRTYTQIKGMWDSGILKARMNEFINQYLSWIQQEIYHVCAELYEYDEYGNVKITPVLSQPDTVYSNDYVRGWMNQSITTSCAIHPQIMIDIARNDLYRN